MSGAATAWFPFYVGDYLGDTQRLTTEQHGAYLLLILDYWRAGPPPDDDDVLRQIVRLDAKSWKRHRAAIARMFQITDGEWRHKRVDAELSVAEQNAERRSSKARAAANARWGDAASSARSDAAGNAASMPDAMLGACPPQSPSPKKNSDPNGSGAAAPIGTPMPDPDKVMFDSGKAMLAAAGTPAEAAGRLLGKWRREYGSGAVITALAAAKREGAIEPKSFIEGALRHGQRPHHDRPSGAVAARQRFREQHDVEPGGGDDLG
jgi:uncharacterized protein YdaU (DUF1376 family)